MHVCVCACVGVSIDGCMYVCVCAWVGDDCVCNCQCFYVFASLASQLHINTLLLENCSHALYSLCTLEVSHAGDSHKLAKSGNHTSINVRRFNGLACSFLNEIPHMLMMVYVHLGSEEVMEHLHACANSDFEDMAN